MIYTEVEKKELDEVQRVFAEHLRQCPDYELLWSDKVGYQRYSLMEHLGSVIHPYKDCLIFVAPGGRITRVDYETGETIVLTDDATSHHHLDGGLFRKSSSWDEPVEFNRVGNYIYYFANGDYSRVCKLSITNPNEKEVFSRDYESFREGIIEKT